MALSWPRFFSKSSSLSFVIDEEAISKAERFPVLGACIVYM